MSQDQTGVTAPGGHEVAGLRRWAIIGCGGSGKSTFARALGERTGLPVIHLDRFYWGPGWVKSSTPEWEQRVAELARRDEWIIDGNYGGTMDIRLAAAHGIVFLDYARRVCLTGALRRRVFARDRPDMTEGCPDRLTAQYLRWIWDYRRTRRPRVFERLAGYRDEKQVFVFDTRAEARHFLETATRECVC